jgi:hypothetical protein
MLRFPSSLATLAAVVGVGLMTCSHPAPVGDSDDLAIATPEYIVLADKAFTYQADFDLEGWSLLLADSVQYQMPALANAPSVNLRGKAALLAYWQAFRQQQHVRSLRFSQFNHIPIRSAQNLKLSGLAGVYVFSLFESELTQTDGRTSTQQLSVCCHFNAQKRIDRCYAYFLPQTTPPQSDS